MIKFVHPYNMKQLPTDSISYDSVLHHKPVEAYPSLITEQKVTGEMNAESRDVFHHPYWVFGIIILCFVLLAWGKLFFKRRLDMIFRAVFAKNYANQLMREGNLFNERIGLVLFLIYLPVISLFVYLSIPLLPQLQLPLSGGLLYLALLGFFFIFWIFKLSLSRLLSALFNTGEHAVELLGNMYLFNLFAGIVLLPLVACMAFADPYIFFYISLLVLFLTYTYRIIREAQIGFKIIKFSPFHLFLYLCTLEILPIIVLAKIVIRNIN